MEYKSNGAYFKKYVLEQMLDEIAFSFPDVFHAILISDPIHFKYTARVCCHLSDEPIEVTENIWDYDKLLLGVEEKLINLYCQDS